MAQNNENTEQSCAAVTLCTGGCGFFGNSQFAGMCSKCYKDALKRKQATNTPTESSAGRASPRAAAAISAAASSYLSSIESALPTVSMPPSKTLSPSTVDSTTTTSTGTSTSSTTKTSTRLAESGTASSAATPTTDQLLDATSTPSTTITPASSKPVSEVDSSSVDRPATPASSETKPKKRNRCGTCNKKVGLTGFECRCGGLYCGIHRYSDKHDCQFDYKKEGEDLIRKNNPMVVGAKLQKI